MTEKENLTDMLSSQKFISSNYNIWAGECISQNLKDTMLNILDDEHCIQSTIFNEISSRGWHAVKPASMQEIDTVKNKFQGFATNQ